MSSSTKIYRSVVNTHKKKKKHKTVKLFQVMREIIKGERRLPFPKNLEAFGKKGKKKSLSPFQQRNIFEDLVGP